MLRRVAALTLSPAPLPRAHHAARRLGGSPAWPLEVDWGRLWPKSGLLHPATAAGPTRTLLAARCAADKRPVSETVSTGNSWMGRVTPTQSTGPAPAGTVSAFLPREGELTGPNPTNRGKPGTVRHLAAERTCLRFDVCPGGANRHDSVPCDPHVAKHTARRQKVRHSRSRRTTRRRRLRVYIDRAGPDSSQRRDNAAGWSTVRWPGSSARDGRAIAMSAGPIPVRVFSTGSVRRVGGLGERGLAGLRRRPCVFRMIMGSSGADGGIRTRTRVAPQRFLRPRRLPFRHVRQRALGGYLIREALNAHKKARNFVRAGLERKTGFEPATFSLARRCSTTEPLPHRVSPGTIGSKGNVVKEPMEDS